MLTYCNLPLLLVTLLFIMIAACRHDYSNYDRQVGIIAHDPALDTTDFELCYEVTARPYYQVTDYNAYQGEKPALRAAFDTLQWSPTAAPIDGYITIRFMVNCHGQSGRFRVEQLDTQYRDKAFDPTIVQALLHTTRRLDGWLREPSGRDQGRYLTFKIEQNELVDILP